MVTNTRERRLWWRHLISVLLFPVTVTLVDPGPDRVAGRRASAAPTVSPLTAGLVDGRLLADRRRFGPDDLDHVLFDRVGKGTLGLGNVIGEPVHLVVPGPTGTCATR